MKNDYKTSGEVAAKARPDPAMPAPGTSAGYLELLKNNPNFRFFWSAQLVSAAGDWFNNVALLGLVDFQEEGGIDPGFQRRSVLEQGASRG